VSIGLIVPNGEIRETEDELAVIKCPEENESDGVME
jgi:hypothetical protein